MNNQNEKRKDFSTNMLIIIIVLIVLIVFVFMLIKPFNDLLLHPNGELFGQFGGFIGGLFGTLVSLVAAILLYKTLIAQKSTLLNQQESFEIERFETTFFNLLKTQREIANDISVYLPYLENDFELSWFLFKHMDFFWKSKNELKQIWKSLENEKYTGKYDKSDKDFLQNKIEELYEPKNNSSVPILDPDERKDDIINDSSLSLVNRFYGISEESWLTFKSKSLEEKVKYFSKLFFQRHFPVTGHYFNSFNLCIEFIAENEKISDKKKYSSILLSQISTFELSLIFYYSFNQPKLQKILKEYDFFYNLSVEYLVDKSHNCIPGIDLKNRTELINSLDYKS